MEMVPAPRRTTRARRRRERSWCARTRWLVGAVLSGMLLLAAALALANGRQGLLGLVWVFDDFLDTSQVDAARTTALVDIAAPGLVRLPQVSRPGGGLLSSLAALRPGRPELVVAIPSPGASEPTELAGFAGDGRRMRPFPAWDRSSVGPIRALTWSGDGGHLAAATDSGVQVYATDAGGSLRPVATVPVAGTASLAPGPGRDLWLLDGARVRYLAWDGTRYRELVTQGLSGLVAPAGISSNSDRGVLLVLDGERVRYFSRGGGQYRELAGYGIQVQGALSVAALRGGGYSVLVADGQEQGARTVHVGITATGARLEPAAEDVLPEPAWALVPSPWGDMDYAALSAWGLRYRAHDGRTWRMDPSRSVQGDWWQSVAGLQRVYVPDAALVSTVFPAQLPVGRVRVTADYQTPPGTAVGFDLSTDGGATWMAVPVGENVDVSMGYQLAYRVRLHTDDEQATPLVDRVEIRQVVYADGRGPALGMRVRVRLVK